MPTRPSSPGPRIGIDLGGTKTEIAVLSRSGGYLLRRRVDTPRHDYEATVRTIAELVMAAEQAVDVACTVGVGIPGAISPASGLVKNANSTWLNGKPLLQDLQAALGRPVRIQNDANCLAMSEAGSGLDGGAGDGAGCVLALILGTGVGAGICIDGRLLTGRNAIAGEWGHNPLPASGPGTAGTTDHARADDPPALRCWCGRQGCIETWLSGPALAADFERAQRREQAGGTGVRSSSPANGIDARSVFLLADQGNEQAVQAVDRWLDRLARSLGVVINLLDPDVIVVGGGLSNAGVIYRELPRRWAAHVFSDRIETPVRPARHGDSSGVRGAAWLWP